MASVTVAEVRRIGAARSHRRGIVQFTASLTADTAGQSRDDEGGETFSLSGYLAAAAAENGEIKGR
jgi:hypothetical protein